MRPRMYAPLDPECPDVIDYYTNMVPDMRAFGAPVEEFIESFERSHRKECKRCEEFGLANIEIN